MKAIQQLSPESLTKGFIKNIRTAVSDWDRQTNAYLKYWDVQSKKIMRGKVR